MGPGEEDEGLLGDAFNFVKKTVKKGVKKLKKKVKKEARKGWRKLKKNAKKQAKKGWKKFQKRAKKTMNQAGKSLMKSASNILDAVKKSVKKGAKEVLTNAKTKTLEAVDRVKRKINDVANDGFKLLGSQTSKELDRMHKKHDGGGATERAAMSDVEDIILQGAQDTERRIEEYRLGQNQAADETFNEVGTMVDHEDQAIRGTIRNENKHQHEVLGDPNMYDAYNDGYVEGGYQDYGGDDMNSGGDDMNYVGDDMNYGGDDMNYGGDQGMAHDTPQQQSITEAVHQQ